MRFSEITEAIADNVVVFYGGRFQPMHIAHKQVYQHLVDKFGATIVFIDTTFSQKAQKAHAMIDFSSDPFTFDEKKMIMGSMFGIPADKVVQTQPYRPDVTLTGKDPNNTAVILVFSAKDAGRLKRGGFLRDYEPGAEMVPSDQGAYIYAVPIQEGGMSATDFRTVMKNESLNDNQKMMQFREFFGSVNPKMFAFIKDKLNV